jgi:hypothetical protein
MATGLEWVVNAYAVTFGGLLLLGGRAGDRLGRHLPSANQIGSRPPSSSKLPNASAYVVTTHCRPASENPRSRWAEGSAMFTMKASPRDDNDYWQWTAAKRQAGREWQDIRERSMRSQRSIHDNGGHVGEVPDGYTLTGPKYGKKMVAAPAGKQLLSEIMISRSARRWCRPGYSPGRSTSSTTGRAVRRARG